MFLVHYYINGIKQKAHKTKTLNPLQSALIIIYTGPISVPLVRYTRAGEPIATIVKIPRNISIMLLCHNTRESTVERQNSVVKKCLYF